MSTATLRKLGGSTVVAIPPTMLELLKCRSGDSVNFTFSEGCIEIRPAKKEKMSLSDRLALYSAAKALKTKDDTMEDAAWLNDKAVGKEVL